MTEVDETFVSLFRDIAVGFVKWNFEKEHGRPPKFGEIENLSVSGVKIELTKEDFEGDENNG